MGTLDAREMPRRPATVADRLYDPATRGLLVQVLLVVLILAIGIEMVSNAAANLKRQGIASGFDFLGRTAGFEIAQALVDYAPTDTYARAFLVGLLNTVLVAAVGIVLATVVGFTVGIARLSSNWLVSRLALAYVEIVRNMPPLLSLFFVYFALLKALPGPRQSLALPLSSYLNVRGLYLPAPVWGQGSWLLAVAFVLGLVAAAVVARWARARRVRTGRPFPVLWSTLAPVAGLPLMAFLAAGRPLAFDYPALKGFNFQGGVVVMPELLALVIGLTLYTAAFIAEIVRAGIEGVPKGQKEAAVALGLTPRQAMRLVVLPLAMRIVIPPLTNQYLNLTKNSSLAIAIGYPDLVSVFAGTVLNNTNQAIECVLITMAVYLGLSVLTALVMNWFNARFALRER